MRVDTVAGACLIFTGTLLIYVSTLYASAAGGDASEFAFVACDHSIAHPPGYPTFTMLASVGTDLFRGEYFGTRGPAWGANFISAVAGAGCAATLYIAIVTASGDATTDRLTVHASAALGSGLLALQRNVWLNTIQSEVFGLNNLFIALAVLCAVRLDKSTSIVDAAWGALVCGLAMTNQHTFVLFGAPLAAWALFCPCRRGGLLTPPHIFCLLLLPLVGIVPYAYLIFNSGRLRNGNYFGQEGVNPPGAWGATHTVKGFITHVTRQEYGSFRLYSGAERGDHRAFLGLRNYLWNLSAETYGIALPLMTAASWAAAKGGGRKITGKHFPGLAPVLVAYTICTVVFQLIANLPIENELYLGVSARFWMQSDVAAGFIIGCGTAFLAEIASPKFVLIWPKWSQLSHVLGGIFGFRSLTFDTGFTNMCVVVAILTARLATNHSAMDESDNRIFEAFGREMLRPLPSDARLMVRGDLITNSARYVQRCLGYRRDVQMIDISMLTYKWFVPVQGPNFPGFVFPGTHYHPYEKGGFSMRVFLDANLAGNRAGMPSNRDGNQGSKDIFLAGGWHDDDASTKGFYTEQPFGIADRIVSVDSAMNMKRTRPQWIFKEMRTTLPNMTDALPAKETVELKYPEGRWERVAIKDYYAAHHRLAFELLTWGLSDAKEINDERSTLSTGKAMDDSTWPFERCVEIIGWCVSEHPKPVPSFYWRNLGICHQQLLVARKNLMNTNHNSKMLSAWTRYVESGQTDEVVRMEEGYDVIAHIVATTGHTARNLT